MAQKTEKRGKEILYLLLHEGKTSVDQLAELFQTSSTSVRRDLARLERQGLVHRTHGGAMLAGQTYEPFRFDATFTEREKRFQREKQMIGTRAATLIEDGETIGLTAGTTTTQVARALRGRKGLRVLTNAVNIGLELSASEGPQTTLTGGSMIWSGAFSLTGATALEAIQGFVLDRILLGVTGIDIKHGATMIELEEAAVSRAMVRQAREVIVVADSSKVGMTSRAVICSVQKINVLVTDNGIPGEARAELERHGVRVLIVDM
ncbi:MAG: DeoR/GlpR family DNA-binding transcription regulator [Acidobacteriaceae bacterium]